MTKKKVPAPKREQGEPRTEVTLKVDVKTWLVSMQKGKKLTVLEDRGSIGVLIQHPADKSLTLPVFNHELVEQP